ncbi:hybrid sensor histidine kinase/response regulator [Limnothrix sp. FACHB-708]|uniref:hybrid sensor histidine kinase/response regulator n=1 Tax=unclassified Limnothrix TaxID=2632864 RepID=UPI0016866ED8|nr:MULTISPECIES: hybrid sensor histidine kinase/response regulator [unclassified Limnothrix]MBD2552738.1 hybrid sensor histidine kinase/response regulator [Limnothrix sp. FACHB-708]MBD2590008.1 hybrid sensor histidine kinase/response regulator [Limnothrix sp. FACHB-406]
MLDPAIREEAYGYFLSESQDLLRSIETDLLQLRDDPSKQRIHALMRATHTLKGASANVGLETISTIAHHMEDVFRALFDPEAEVEVELEGLLFQLYECLRLALTTQWEQGREADQEVLDQAIDAFARIQTLLGDCFEREQKLPTSAELGFDLVQSIFETGVKERIDQLATLVAAGDGPAALETVATQSEVFTGLGESLGLPGFQAIAEAALQAVAHQGDRPLVVAQAVLSNWQAAQEAVLAGDRTQGGEVSAELAALAGQEPEPGDLGDLTEGTLDLSMDLSDEMPAGWLDLTEGTLDLTTDSPPAPTPAPPIAGGSPAVAAPAPAPVAAPVPAPPNSPPAPLVTAETAPRGTPEPARSAEPQRVDSKPLTPTPLIRVEIDRLQSLQHLVGELLINENRQSLQDEQLRSALERFRQGLRQHRRLLAEARDRLEKRPTDRRSLNGSPAATSANDLILQQSIDAALDSAERLDSTAEVVERYAQQTATTLDKQRRLLGQVRDSLMDTRMQPAAAVFDRFGPLVRQLCARYGKTVHLRVVGERVAIDKVAIEQLYDPLLHLVRNAFDHGIEAVEERRDRGKPAEGTIELRAQQQGNHVLIWVADDGKGIDPQRLRQKAIERGWLTPDRAQTASDQALLDLLFEPGFSTADKVTDLSGRGVGLDVVRSQMRSLKGSVTIQSSPGRGTAFILRVPLSLMTARLLVCQADRAAYALPSESVRQILIPQPEQTQMLGGQRILRWRASSEDPEITIPIRKLAELMRYSSLAPGLLRSDMGAITPFLSNRLAPLLLMDAGDTPVAIEVDGVVGEQELVLRQLSEALPAPRYIYGCTILGDGRMVLAIDGNELLTQVEAVPIVAAAPPELPQPAAPPAIAPELPAELPNAPIAPHSPTTAQGSKTLLVVEDSDTERRLLTLTLERQGYRVVQAVDGLEALTQLRQRSDIDLVISDIEMPRMTGLEFLNARRQHPNAAQVPVILLTSCSGTQYKQVALSLGAADYMLKPHVTPELVASIERLTGDRAAAVV